MEKHIEPRIVLLAADKIRQHGTRQDDAYVLDGVRLLVSPDEYTLHLQTTKVDFYLYFHQKFKADAKKESDLEMFYTCLERIVQTQYDAQ